MYQTYTLALSCIVIISRTQPAITYLKLTKETLEKGVKYVQSYLKKHQNDAKDVVLASLLLTLNIFHTLFLCFYCQL